MKKKILILCGMSATGKDYALNYLVNKYDTLAPIVSYTTRPTRDGEVDGREYHFVSLPEFDELLDIDEITEFREYNTIKDGLEQTWYYGTPVLHYDGNYVLVATLEAINAFKKRYGSEVVEAVYIHTDDIVRRERAESRGSFCRKEWERRVWADSLDFNEDLVIHLCDYFITNNDGDEFEQQLDDIVHLVFDEEYK